MKLISLHISTFGKLQNVDLDFSEGVNILSQKNGFGKTTLAAFIRAMLYGFKYNLTKTRTSERVSDAARWLTWNSTEKIGGSLKVSQNGEVFVIERYFGARATQETLSIVCQSNGKQIQLETTIGEWLLGLTAESFDRSAYFPQEAVEISSNENFDTRLAGLVQNAEEFSKVMKNLDDYRKKFKLQRGNGGLIYDLENRKMTLAQQIFDCSTAEKRQKEINSLLTEISAQKAQLSETASAQNDETEHLQKQLAQAQPSAKQLQNAEKLQELRQKTARLEGLSQDYKVACALADRIENTPEEAKPQKRPVSRVMLIVAALLVAAGMGLFFVNLWACVAAVSVGAICLVLAFFVRPPVKTLPSGERDSLVTQYFAVAGKYVFTQNQPYAQVQKKLWQVYTDYVADCRERDAIEQMTTTARQNTDELSSRLAEVKALSEQTQQQLQTLSRREGELVAEMKSLNSDSVSAREMLAATETQLAAAKRQFETAQKVAELLLQAKENLSSSYVPQLAARCGTLLNAVTDGRYQVTADRNFVIKLTEHGVTKSLEFFSRGVREITLLCFRLALSEMLFGGKIPLLIVDDAFVNFDEQNFTRATQLLRKMSAETQILYFTCHNRLGALK